jgi:hypothetical protein
MGDREIAEELLLFLQSLSGITSRVKSDHILNLFEEIDGVLPDDQERMMAVIRDFLAMDPEEQVLYQIGRRTGVFRRLDDCRDPVLRRQALGYVEQWMVTPENVDQVCDSSDAAVHLRAGGVLARLQKNLHRSHQLLQSGLRFLCPDPAVPRTAMDVRLLRRCCAKSKASPAFIALHVLGEPLLASRIWSLLALSPVHGLRVNLTTNGTLLGRHRPDPAHGSGSAADQYFPPWSRPVGAGAAEVPICRKFIEFAQEASRSAPGSMSVCGCGICGNRGRARRRAAGTTGSCQRLTNRLCRPRP